MNTVRTSTETGNIRKYQAKVTELKNIISELKNAPQRFNSRLHETKESVTKLYLDTLQKKEGLNKIRKWRNCN